ncbi:DUF1367 family protein [Proteus mirabilis]|uniref:DUF1367 family protein n=1 Tax=Proteus mirabilis TaxID=584 RepID=UPI0018C7362D|nr:DUF1367 family protein [Proteus mirabilis]MBG2888675.1 DUF1367 family protein [Proteus mirabilis]MBI6378959.1 DUF1367 family protein [Proteus mirabilis]MCL8621326.1 DUF1367 family protein [Proteus mirabilis]MCL8632413.1 DUF1367 family protein [Proteus mirabilis]MCU9582397.1 DUF1367 family protein [Proteus mirabilis]
MAQHSFIKMSNDTLVPANPVTRDFLHSKIKCGDVLSANFKKARNPRFHRKYFSLLNLGYEYWEPVGGTISPEEKELVRGYITFLSCYTDNADALLSASDIYLEEVAQKRAQNISATKSFDAFRYWVVEQAGYYDTFEMPDGSLRRVAKSISFANMDDLAFSELYKATLDVLWNFILRKQFPTQKAVENAVSQLLSFT